MKMQMQKHFRQGDVLIVKIDSIPTNAQLVKNKVVAVGEGHHEHIVDDETEVFQSGDSLYLSVNAEGKLEHVITGTKTKAEHNPINLAAGSYKVVLQREYDPYEDHIRQVRD